MGTRTPYPDEFKQEAIKLVTEQGLRRSQVARDLGIDPQTLRRWLHAAATPEPPVRQRRTNWHGSGARTRNYV